MLIISLNSGFLQSQELDSANIPSEICIDYTKTFWMKSQKALTKKFLIKVLLPQRYFESDTTHFPALYLTDADLFFFTAMDVVSWVKPDIVLIGISYGSKELCWKNRGNDFRPARTGRQG